MPTKARIRPGVDVRGDGGYVVGPCSIHASGHVYAEVDPWPDSIGELPVFDPSWLDMAAPSPRSELGAASSPTVASDADRAGLVKRARAYLVEMGPAIEGQGGDAHTFHVCCVLVRDFALDASEARQLLAAWNANCVPPWSAAELDNKIANALRYGQGPIGAKAANPAHGASVNSPAAAAAEPPDGADTFEARVSVAYERERANREARRRLDREERPPAPVPAVETLRERLRRPRTEAKWRIEGWQSKHSRVLLAAQFKAGKTTLVGNLTRALVDGDPFLGAAVVDDGGTVAILDTEMSAGQLDDWLRAQQIQQADRVIVLPLRGAVSSFDILDDRVRGEWAGRFRAHGTSYLILDCLRPVLDALGLDEHHDAGRFLVAFDALLREAAIPDALVVHHMGHAGERSRGDSRLRDWPDVEWRLVRRHEDPSSARFITAFGRDVDVPECQLLYDGPTRRLSVTMGTRKDAASRDALDAGTEGARREPGAVVGAEHPDGA